MASEAITDLLGATVQRNGTTGRVRAVALIPDAVIAEGLAGYCLVLWVEIESGHLVRMAAANGICVVPEAR